MSIFRDQAIRIVHPNATTIDDSKVARDEDWNLIELNWTKINQEESKLLADYDSKKYQRDREIAYPSITDVVVALAEKQEGDDTMWKQITTLRQKVKSENPKPT